MVDIRKLGGGDDDGIFAIQGEARESVCRHTQVSRFISPICVPLWC